MTEICTANTLLEECTGQNLEWTQGASCSSVSCDAAPGACLTLFNPNPKSRDCLCDDGVSSNNCQGDKQEWVKGAACSQVLSTCVPNYNSIPTVSEWGLVVLALVLVVMAKLAFGYTSSCKTPSCKMMAPNWPFRERIIMPDLSFPVSTILKIA